MSSVLIAPALDQDISIIPSERGFAALRDAYRATGGIADGDDLARLLEERQLGRYMSLARLIVLGGVFSFEWRGVYWIPMFQFGLQDLSLKPGPRQVLTELMPVLDAWPLAVWFAKPNTWLSRQRPVDLLDADLPGVLHAAQADRLSIS